MQASSGSDTTTAALARQAREGNRAAFRMLVDRYQDDIFRMIYYRVRLRADAEDLTQEVFIRAFRRLHGLKDDARFRSWLYRIAVNRVRDHLRKKRLRALFVSTPTGAVVERAVGDVAQQVTADAEHQLARQEFWQRIGTVLDRFSRMEREVFLLRFFDGLSIKEIAQVVAKSQSTVKTHLYRGIAKFRQSRQARRLLKEVMS